jgi:hypothetical protein
MRKALDQHLYETKMSRLGIVDKKPENRAASLNIAEILWAIVTVMSVIALLRCLAA